MRYAIRKPSTGQYLTVDGIWSDSIEDAKLFKRTTVWWHTDMELVPVTVEIAGEPICLE